MSRTLPRGLGTIVATVEKLDRLLKAAKPSAPPPDPERVDLKVYQKAPASDPDFPGLTPGKEKRRKPFWEVDESTSRVLEESMRGLMEMYYKAQDVDRRMRLKRKESEEALQLEFRTERDETFGKLPDKTKEVFRIVEKNRGVIQEGEDQMFRMLSMVIKVAGKIRTPGTPEPLGEDPRVEAAIAWIAEKVPTLLSEFMALLTEVEANYLNEQTPGGLVEPRRITVVDPTKQFDVQKTSSMNMSAFDLIQMMSSLWGKLKSVVQDLTHAADELEGLVE